MIDLSGFGRSRYLFLPVFRLRCRRYRVRLRLARGRPWFCRSAARYGSGQVVRTIKAGWLLVVVMADAEHPEAKP